MSRSFRSRPTLAIFPTRDSEGEQLVELAQSLAEKWDMDLKPAAAHPTYQEYVKATLEEDAVLVDASIAARGAHNYSFLAPTPLDHVLVFSRTPLPLNYYGGRDSILDPESGRLVHGAPFYPERQTNAVISRWIDLQLADLRPSLPRSHAGLVGTMAVGMERSVDLQNARRRRDGSIFISYRSNDDPAVKVLKQRIEGGEIPGIAPAPVRYFPPHVLCDELAPEQRRWQILSAIDRYIGPADEIWVYLSSTYHNSWWTQGERVTLAYRGIRAGGEPGTPKIRIMRPDHDRPEDAPDDLLPRLNDAQHRRMARWYANSDAAQMAPESVVAMRLIAALPLVGRVKFFRDPVWSNEFWRYPILDCAACREPAGDGTAIEIDDFLWTRGRHVSRLTPEAMVRCIVRGEVSCPQCLTRYEIFADTPHHLWVRAVNGRVTSGYFMDLFGIQPEDPEEKFLVPLPTYRLKML
jgi:hypothetical protein